MTTPTKTVGRYGRRKPSNKAHIAASRILKPRTAETVLHPTAVDYIAGVGGGWQMLGNDAAGDCVAVMVANDLRLVTHWLAAQGIYVSQADVWKFYQSQNPDFDPNGTSETNGPGSNADGGMDIQTALEYLVSTGIGGYKAAAFAKVNVKDLDELKAALAVFGNLGLGIIVTAANESEFPSKAWDYVKGSPEEGGHGIVGGGYTGDATAAGDMTFVTWGEEQKFTDKFLASTQLEEAWIIVWPYHFGSASFMANVDVTQLAADYLELTGKVLVVPPTPGPTPAPPTPTPPTPVTGATFLVSAEVAAAVAAVAGKHHPTETPDAWVEHTLRVHFKLPVS